MAEILKNIPTNLTEYPNSFKRQGCFPLEAYSVFYNTTDKDGKVTTAFENAENYAKTNAIAYVGQTLAVVDATYSETEVDGKKIDTSVVNNVTFYIIANKTGDNVLQEVGKATNGDGKSITLTDGTLSLTGFDAASVSTLPQKQAVYKVVDGQVTEEIDHYEIKWVSIDAIVEGDGNTKSVVASGSSNVTVSSNYDATSDTYTYSISVAEQEIPDVPEYAIKKLETPSEGSQATYKLTKDGNEVDVAIEIPAFPVITHPEYTIVKETRAEGATETIYHLAKDGEEVTTDIIVPDAYDDTALADRVAAVETFFKTADGETLDAALDTLIEIQKYIDEDGEVAEQVLANKQAIETLNGDENTAGSVANAIKVASSNLSSQISAVDTKASNAQKAIDDYDTAHAADYTNTQIDEAISSAIIAENLGQYAISSEVQSALDGKQDTITATEIVHTSDTKTEGVTLTNGKLSIVVDAYTKTETYTKNEVNDAIRNKISEMTGGESAADVLSALNDYKKANDAEVYGDKFVADAISTNSDGKEVYSPDYTKDSRIDIVTKVASTNSSNLDVLLGTGAGSVAEAKKAGTDAAAAVDALSKGQVTTNKNDIAALVTRVGTVESTVGGHTTEIATLTGKVTALEGADTTINATLGEHTASITALGQKDAELAGLISGNTTAINNEATARTDADNALAARIKVYEDNKDSYATKAEVKVNTDAIAVLNAADTGKSVREIAADEVAKIVGTAPEAFDTLEEVATWIANDTSGAAAMANDIAALKTAVNTTLPAAIATAKSEAIDTAKSEALAEVSTKYVTADAENNLSLNGQTIVLCGGNAEASSTAE